MEITELYTCLDLELKMLGIAQYKLYLFDNKIDVYYYEVGIIIDTLLCISNSIRYEEKPYGVTVWLG